MLIELMAYYIGAPLLRPSESFWIYTNLDKEALARVIEAMKANDLDINERNLFNELKVLSTFPNHEWIKVARLEECLPMTDVDASLN